MTRTALALSPHLDDAAFSCGGMLARLARTGWRVIVATLFTRSMPDPQGFALACQLDKGIGPEVDYMALRRAEDVAAMQALGAEPPIHVPLPEAPHRGYGSAQALFGPVLPDDVVAGPLREAVRTLLADHRPSLVLAPQAIGGHVDHVQVVRALDDLRYPILWWRDFPYTVRTSEPPQPFRLRFETMSKRRFDLDERDRLARESGCLAYASQLGFQFGGADGLRAKLRHEEHAAVFRADPFDEALISMF